MNEGWATFWHYTILNQLYDEGVVGDGFMMEFLKSHTNVVYQPPIDSPYYSGINPYALGFAMMSDIRRICEHPTDEDEAGGLPTWTAATGAEPDCHAHFKDKLTPSICRAYPRIHFFACSTTR